MNSSSTIPFCHLLSCASAFPNASSSNRKKYILLNFIILQIKFCLLLILLFSFLCFFCFYFINIGFEQCMPIAAIAIQVLFAFGFIDFKNGRNLFHVFVIYGLFSCLL